MNLDIPKSWTQTPLSSLINSLQYGINESARDSGNAKLLRITDLRNNCIDWESVPFCTANERELEKYLLKKGDIVIARSGSVGLTYEIESVPHNGIFASYLIRISPSEFFRGNGFLLKYFKSKFFWDYISKTSQGATLKNINSKIISSLLAVLPPLKEQKRIVQKIESCFEKIDAIEEDLIKAEDLLKRFRKSILSKAFRGKLVPQNSNDESASILLEKILKEREKNQGNKKKKQSFRPIFDDEKPFDIPESWKWVRLEEVTKNFDGKRMPIKSSDRKERKGAYPYYGASGIIDYFDNYIFDGEYLLISEDGANLLARTYPIAFVADGKFWVNNHAHVVKALNYTTNNFLKMYFESLDISKWVTGAAQPKFNQAKLNSVPIPLPPLREQNCIVQKIESSFEIANDIEKLIKEKRQLLQKSKNSILQKAFCGKLVPQIESDGTGHELLQKILEAKKSENRKTKKKSTGQKKRTLSKTTRSKSSKKRGSK